MSFDAEYAATTEQIEQFVAILLRLKTALNPLGARVTTYSDYTTLLNNISLLSSVVDRVLGGQTYNAPDYDGWLDSLQPMISSDVPRDKISPAQLGATERGDWNCETAGMEQRLAYMLTLDIVEFSVFSFNGLNGTSSQEEFCTDLWFPFMRDFIAKS